MPDALLFDLDGTLLDSDPLHLGVFQSILGPRGYDVDQKFYMARIHGRLNVEVFAELTPDEDAHAMDIAKEAAFRELLTPGAVAPTPGLIALLDRAQAMGLPMAVVTNACRLNADAMLAAIGLADRFAAVIVADECAAGKPDPAPYRAGAAALRAKPTRCLAFEDSPTGIASAQAAGCTVVGMTSSLVPAALKNAGARYTIKDFTDPVLAQLLGAETGAMS